MKKAAFLIHGFLTQSQDFSPLLPHLKDKYDFILCPDLPAHGQDFCVSKNRYINSDDIVGFVLSQFDILKKSYDKIDVFGFSMGGALARMLAAQRQVNKLILLAPALKATLRVTYLDRLILWQTHYLEKNDLLKNKDCPNQNSEILTEIDHQLDLNFDQEFINSHLDQNSTADPKICSLSFDQGLSKDINCGDVYLHSLSYHDQKDDENKQEKEGKESKESKERGQLFKSTLRQVDTFFKKVWDDGVSINDEEGIRHDFKMSREIIYPLVPRIGPKNILQFFSVANRCNKAIKQSGISDVPSLILWGRLDQLVPFSSIKACQISLSNCKTIIYNDITHSMLYSKYNEKIVKDITDWLEKQDSEKQDLNTQETAKETVS
ncbi:MAG: alpha/beta hydrolase [Firmicutes bacterium]|nr:alpha/beta hydrolase [Bacillota bacterium]